MKFFHNDYNEICHDAVLKRMLALQGAQKPGYGEDDLCAHGADMIRDLCEDQSLSVYFLSGGTQTNLTVITAALRPHQAVLAPVTAHISAHETGAIEAAGHKVMTLQPVNGKITAAQIRDAVLAQRNDESFVFITQPKLVYISQATEFGSVYTLREMEQIREVCDELGLYLFADGARLGYALASDACDMTMADMARLTDVFYMGGTKQGTMIGEAVVISNPAIDEDFRYIIKQRGGLLAKGFVMGAQFEALLENGLYFKEAAKADRLAVRIKDTLVQCGCQLYGTNDTNQIFATVPNALLKKLDGAFTYAVWEKTDHSHTLVRFCTSWATKEEDVDALCDALKGGAGLA